MLSRRTTTVGWMGLSSPMMSPAGHPLRMSTGFVSPVELSSCLCFDTPTHLLSRNCLFIFSHLHPPCAPGHALSALLLLLLLLHPMQWINEMRKNTSGTVQMILIGNKVDVPENERVVSAREGNVCPGNGSLKLCLSAVCSFGPLIVAHAVAAPLL